MLLTSTFEPYIRQISMCRHVNFRRSGRRAYHRLKKVNFVFYLGRSLRETKLAPKNKTCSKFCFYQSLREKILPQNLLQVLWNRVTSLISTKLAATFVGLRVSTKLAHLLQPMYAIRRRSTTTFILVTIPAL